MDILRCEVIGCCCPAVWVRTRELEAIGEDLLCGECWRHLRLMSHTKAARYEKLVTAQLKTAEPTAEREAILVIQ